MTVTIREPLRTKAYALGFDAVGFARAEIPSSARGALATFLAEGRHGTMAWMAAERRDDPRKLWPEAASVIALGLSYAPPRAARNEPWCGAISVYAQHKDYHDVFQSRLKELGEWMRGTFAAEFKVFVDTAPLLEKPLAQMAGVGWQGRHTNLVSRRFGAWLFLGEILTSLVLPPDPPHPAHCGSCHRCVAACPTGALTAEGHIDARLCISYLTIEHKGPVPRALRPMLGNRIYGCDDCLAVCPWNRFAAPTREAAFQPHPDRIAPALADLAALDGAGFAERFRGSPVRRIGRDRLVRNVLMAIGNSGLPDLMPCVRARLEDSSALVRGAAVWAVARLLDPAPFAALRACHLPAESDETVREEWRTVQATGNVFPP
ncbi:MAG: (Fe-S)-binding protein [Rhodospirillaceae bacterium]|nr:MAG: (Fe-S)-binding protein [Rhodospirillaceae bacterium]